MLTWWNKEASKSIWTKRNDVKWITLKAMKINDKKCKWKKLSKEKIQMIKETINS